MKLFIIYYIKYDTHVIKVKIVLYDLSYSFVVMTLFGDEVKTSCTNFQSKT